MVAMVTLTLAILLLLAIAVVFSGMLGWADSAFRVAIDARVDAIASVLPGANCGGCGYIGCGEYAEAVARGEAGVTLCAPGGAACAQGLAEIMGVDPGETFPWRAVIHCAATRNQRLGQGVYQGEGTCAAANLVAGYQGCVYGCLGLGDCVEVCDYQALRIEEGLAVVDYDRCVGCRACAKVCPRNIISLVPFKANRMLVVACSNQDFANDVKAVCEVGCTGCGSCARKNDLFEMENNLPVIDYDQYGAETDLRPVLEKCKMESLLFVGVPGDEEGIGSEEPATLERAVADFKTTVDELEWRG
jgi:Na+-translocating ferredoxin:NAD+ oxidoreductase RNF subunit RnfB